MVSIGRHPRASIQKAVQLQPEVGEAIYPSRTYSRNDHIQWPFEMGASSESRLRPKRLPRRMKRMKRIEYNDQVQKDGR